MPWLQGLLSQQDCLQQLLHWQLPLLLLRQAFAACPHLLLLAALEQTCQQQL